MLLTGLLCGSCGYTAGTGLSEYGIRTVAFQVVGNHTYRQRLEAQISSELARQLPLTGLILADRATADAVLEVTLTDVRERTLVTGTGRPIRDDPNPANPRAFPRVREGALESAVWMRLVGRDGTIYLERRLMDRTEFRATIGENVTSARAELAEDLARKIASALATDF
jgi:hypothetical protein